MGDKEQKDAFNLPQTDTDEADRLKRRNLDSNSRRDQLMDMGDDTMDEAVMASADYQKTDNREEFRTFRKRNLLTQQSAVPSDYDQFVALCQQLPAELISEIFEYHVLYLDRWENLFFNTFYENESPVLKERQPYLMSRMFGYFARDKERKIFLVFKNIRFSDLEEAYIPYIKFKDLRALFSNNCSISDRKMVDVLKQNPSLTHIYGLPASDQTLATLISKNGTLNASTLSQSFELRAQCFRSVFLAREASSSLTSSGIMRVAGISSTLQNLTELSLSMMEIKDEGAIWIATYFTKLKTAILKGCKITDRGATALFKSKSIQRLYLNTNQVSGTSMAQLKLNSTIRLLDLTNNSKIDDDALKHLQFNTTLRSLNLSSCPFTDTGLFYVSRIPSLTNLNISCNRGITDQGFLQFLSKGAQITTSTGQPTPANLEVLNLSTTRLTDEAFHKTFFNYQSLTHLSIATRNCSRQFFDTINSMPNLAYLNIFSYQPVLAKGETEEPILPLVKNTTIRTLYLAMSKISNQFIQNLVTTNTSLTELDLSSTKVDDETAKVIFEKNTTLKKLHLQNTKITDACLHSLRHNKTLTSLNLSSTSGITNDAEAAILHTNHCLEELYLIDTKIQRPVMKKIFEGCYWITHLFFKNQRTDY